MVSAQRNHSSLNIIWLRRNAPSRFHVLAALKRQLVKAALRAQLARKHLCKNDFSFAALEGEKLFLGLYVDCFGCALDAILQSKQDIHIDRSIPT